MKRFFCLFLALTISLGTIGILLPSLKSNNEQYEAKIFSEELTQLVRKYSNEKDVQNRLLVNTGSVSDSFNAEAVVKSGDFSVMQFGDYETAEKAQKRLTQLGFLCERDSIITVDALKSYDEAEDIDNWATNAVQSPISLKYLKDSDTEFEEINVAVIDTGVNYNHELLKDRVIKLNKNFSASGNINDCADDNGHGTGVAGVIVQNTLDNVKITPYKIFDENAKSTNSLITAVLKYILAQRKLPDVINMSFGISSVSPSAVRDELTQKLIDRGVTAVSSAGNKNVNAKYYYPANIENAITVSSSDKNNSKSSFSNYGEIVDIAAPGSGVYTCNLDGTYSYENGTSFSAPMVSAAAATVLMQNSALSCTEVGNIIKKAAVPAFNKAMQAQWCGAGILNFSGLIVGEKPCAPVFSVSEGKYSEPFELKISADDDEKIIYTTDSSTPSLKNGTVYSQPISISDNMHIIAVAYKQRQKSMYASSTYEIIYDTQESDYTINSKGIITAYSGDKINITVPDKIDSVTVTGIGANVFNKSSVISVVLPDTASYIGVSAFANSCLTSITAKGVNEIDNGAFEGCKALLNADMPEVKSIGNRAFKNCTSLSTVNFRSTLQTAGRNAFAFSSLQNASFPLLTEANALFEGASVIVADMPKLKNAVRTFCECNLLSSASLPSLEKVGSKAFYGCTVLTSLDSTDNIKCIENNGFAGSNIKRLELPSCFETGENAFYKSMCEYIYIPKVETIQSGTFSGCEQLEEVIMPNVSEFSDSNASYFTDCFSLEYLWLPRASLCPNIDFSSSGLLDIRFGKRPKLNYIFAPNAVTVQSSSASPFAASCTRLEYAFIPKAQSIDYLDCPSSAILYLGTSMTSLPEAAENSSLKIIAPPNTYCEKWAYDNSVDFLASSECKCVEASQASVSYVHLPSQTAFSLPTRALTEIWGTQLIGKAPSEETQAMLLDLNNDKITNAKDYSILIKEEKK